MRHQHILVKRLCFATLFKIIFLGLLFSLGPFFLILAFLSLFHLSSFDVFQQSFSGLHGMLVGFCFIFVIPFFISLCLWPFLLVGLWVYSKFASMKIVYAAKHGASTL